MIWGVRQMAENDFLIKTAAKQNVTVQDHLINTHFVQCRQDSRHRQSSEKYLLYPWKSGIWWNHLSYSVADHFWTQKWDIHDHLDFQQLLRTELNTQGYTAVALLSKFSKFREPAKMFEVMILRLRGLFRSLYHVLWFFVFFFKSCSFCPVKSWFRMQMSADIKRIFCSNKHWNMSPSPQCCCKRN